MQSAEMDDVQRDPARVQEFISSGLTEERYADSDGAGHESAGVFPAEDAHRIKQRAEMRASRIVDKGRPARSKEKVANR
jgi:hypothetical protein